MVACVLRFRGGRGLPVSSTCQVRTCTKPYFLRRLSVSDKRLPSYRMAAVAGFCVRNATDNDESRLPGFGRNPAIMGCAAEFVAVDVYHLL